MNNNAWVACAMLASVNTAYGAPPRNWESTLPAMVGGSLLAFSGAESVVALAQSSEGDTGELEVFCTGTLIGRGLVLTAAHCQRSGSMVVFFGDNVAAGGEVRAVRHFTVHPGFLAQVEGLGEQRQVRTDNDLALVSFDGELPATVMPVKMGADDFVTTNQEATLWGFGVSQSSDLQNIWANTTPTTVGTKLGALFHFTGERYASGRVAQLQSMNPDIYPCSGDSGGPVFLRKENGEIRLVGVSSYVAGSNYRDIRCEAGLVHVTLVAFYRDWILRTASALN